jgi:chromosome partitioning protein
MNTIAIANQKGGCGKTTTAINLAAELGARGKRILLIDLDPQGHASLGLGIGDRELPGLFEVFSDETSILDVVLSDVIEGVDLIPANITLAAIEPMLTDQPGRERQLMEQIEGFSHRYDYALIDCPPSLGLLSINALRAATQVLTPVEASIYALDGVQQLGDIVGLLNEKYELDITVTVIPTMFDSHTRFAQTMLRQIRDRLPGGVSEVQVRHTVRAREAAYFGKPLLHYSPDCTAAVDYQRLAEEILIASEQSGIIRIEYPTEDFHDLDHEESAMSSINIKNRRQMVVLTFNDIQCRRLQLAGDFNDWIPDRDVETRKLNGRWQKVFTAEPGVYEYRLLIDGKWQADPTNPAEIPNELGGINSLLQVPVHIS